MDCRIDNKQVHFHGQGVFSWNLLDGSRLQLTLSGGEIEYKVYPKDEACKPDLCWRGRPDVLVDCLFGGSSSQEDRVEDEDSSRTPVPQEKGVGISFKVKELFLLNEYIRALSPAVREFRNLVEVEEAMKVKGLLQSAPELRLWFSFRKEEAARLRDLMQNYLLEDLFPEPPEFGRLREYTWRNLNEPLERMKNDGIVEPPVDDIPF